MNEAKRNEESDLAELLCVKCKTRLVIGDYFIHQHSGTKLVCTGIVRRIVDGKVVTTFELNDA